MVISEGYATEKKVTKRDYRFVSGTWINEEYNSHPHLARYVIRRDGTFDGYFKTTDTKEAVSGHYVIVEKWTDLEGNIWYKSHTWGVVMVEGKLLRYELAKFSNSGKVYENIALPGGFPTELDENNFHYHIYYRQE
jgi:hypothetical protein